MRRMLKPLMLGWLLAALLAGLLCADLLFPLPQAQLEQRGVQLVLAHAEHCDMAALHQGADTGVGHDGVEWADVGPADGDGGKVVFHQSAPGGVRRWRACIHSRALPHGPGGSGRAR